MLKLKDIFNIDISSKGGGKLYKKIMRKYNIPIKDVKEVKQEIVECSSGGCEGVKEYYYRFKDEYLNTDIRKIKLMDMPIMSLLHGLVDIYSIICPIYDNTDNGWDIIGTADVSADLLIINNIKIKPYFKLIDTNVYSMISYQDDKTIDPSAIILHKGNIEDRLNALSSEEDIKSFLEMINGYIQEITKEEYESMITYKPE